MKEPGQLSGLRVASKTVSGKDGRNKEGGLRQVDGEEVYVGIDVSQETLDMGAYPTEQIWQYKNSKKGILKAATKLKAVGPRLIVMEATGGLEQALRDALDEAGLAVAVVNPKRVRDFSRAMGMLAKTDKLDAKAMALFAAKMKPQPHPSRDKAERVLDNLVTRRNQLGDMLTAERNRLKDHLDGAAQMDIEEHISFLEGKIADLDKHIKKKIAENPEFSRKADLFKSMKGVGDVLASTLIAKLPELGHVNRREIASLVGLAPLNRDSGKFRGKRMIQGGRASVRKACYMPAIAAIRYNPVIADLYRRLVARGKLKKVAIVACMHKMLTILNSMVRTNTLWSAATPVSI
jgi:transposase